MGIPVSADRVLSYIDNSNIGDSAARRNRLDRLMFRTNERLPGAVLQAQARVLERLRGISIGSSVSRPSITLDEFSATDVFRIIDFGNREAPYDANRPSSSLAHPSSESDEESSFIATNTFKKSRGLSKAAFLRLQIEIFEASKDDDRESSPECSICLDGFYDGDELIKLRCGHSVVCMPVTRSWYDITLLNFSVGTGVVPQEAQELCAMTDST
uniref:RING-type domain-containing protein n=1 Tax=Leersia perrieri TaxID=77586 RepID=A0A0D9VQZ8_9ORYZ